MMRGFCFSVFLIMAIGCNKADNIPDTPSSDEKSLVVNFFHTIGNIQLRANQDFELSDGRKFRFQFIRHIFTNIVLVNDRGDSVTPDTQRILIRENQTAYPLGRLKLTQGSWKMYILYGVDSLTNTTVYPPMVENAGDPLAPQFPSMYWTWESGYLFTRIEALADTSRVPSGQLNGFVDYHLGKTGLARTIGPFDIRMAGDSALIALSCDMEPVLKSVSWPEEFSSHTFENIEFAEKILQSLALNIRPM